VDKKSGQEKPAWLWILIILTVIVCISLFCVDFFFHRHKVENISWENWYGFYAIYGFAAYTFIVIAAHGLRKLVMRKEDYYDR
jgi:purine-cytosine permease-like protein